MKFLKDLFAYLSILVFALWLMSVIESFIPTDSKWLIITLQVLFVVKVALILGFALIPILLFTKNPIIIKTAVAALLIIMIFILVKSNIAFLVLMFD